MMAIQRLSYDNIRKKVSIRPGALIALPGNPKRDDKCTINLISHLET